MNISIEAGSLETGCLFFLESFIKTKTLHKTKKEDSRNVCKDLRTEEKDRVFYMRDGSLERIETNGTSKAPGEVDWT